MGAILAVNASLLAGCLWGIGSTMNDELCFLSAADLRGRISRKQVSPLEVTKAVLARAERLQPELNCFITLCAEPALAQARATVANAITNLVMVGRSWCDLFTSG